MVVLPEIIPYVILLSARIFPKISVPYSIQFEKMMLCMPLIFGVIAFTFEL